MDHHIKGSDRGLEKMCNEEHQNMCTVLRTTYQGDEIKDDDGEVHEAWEGCIKHFNWKTEREETIQKTYTYRK